MDVVLEKVTAAAQVLGFPALIFFVLVMAYGSALAFQALNRVIMEMQYDRKKRKNAERELDNITSSWLLEPQEEPVYEQGRHDTLDLSDIPDQLYDYQGEQYYEGR